MINKIYKFDTINSTTDWLKDNLQKLSEHNIVICIAETQTSGRGQLGKKWRSQKGNLYFSIMIKNDLLEQKKIISIRSAIAIVNTLDIKGLKLKWPNDLFYNNKKAGGILIEQINNYLIIGVGININLNYKITTQLNASNIENIDKNNFDYNKLIKYITNKNLINIKNDFEKYDIVKQNSNIEIIYNKQKHIGKYLGIDQNGFIIFKETRSKIVHLPSATIVFFEVD